MGTTLEYILTNSYKKEMISYIKSHPGDFGELIELALSDKQPYAWRAAWLLWSCMEVNDKRLHRYLNRIMDVLPTRNDQHLRELLIILYKMELKEEYEGKLFELCSRIWEKIGKNPSVRFNAFKLIVKIVKKHPDLIQEIDLLTQSHYLDYLSDAAQKSVLRMAKRLKKGHIFRSNR
jgi:hypothetical protein